MAGTMKAAVYLGPGRIVVQDVPVPEVGPRDVLIKVKTCGICGSDLHSYKAGFFVEPGQIMGHEYVGEVAAVGAEVSGVAVGERVTGLDVNPCFSCFWCARGQFTLCPDLFGNSTAYGRPGAFAEYIKIQNAIPGFNIHQIPPEIDDETAATIEPVSVAENAVATAGVQSGDKVVVLGAGMLGNLCIQAARAAGAAQVVAVETSPLRLAAARDAGADAVFDARGGDALDWVKRVVGVGRYILGEGGMADVVIEAAGTPKTILQSFEMVRSAGTIMLVGLSEEPTLLDTKIFTQKAPRVLSVLGGDFTKAIALLASGKVKTASLITHRFPLAQIEAAFAMQMRTDEAFKVMVRP